MSVDYVCPMNCHFRLSCLRRDLNEGIKSNFSIIKTFLVDLDCACHKNLSLLQIFSKNLIYPIP